MPDPRVPVVPKGEKEPSSVNGSSGENSSYDSYEYDSSEDGDGVVPEDDYDEYKDEYGDPKKKHKDIKKITPMMIARWKGRIAAMRRMRKKLTKLQIVMKKAVEDKEFLKAHETEQEIKKLQAKIEKSDAQLETTKTTTRLTTTTSITPIPTPTPTKTSVITQRPAANGFPGLQINMFQIPMQNFSSTGFAINFPGMEVKHQKK